MVSTAGNACGRYAIGAIPAEAVDCATAHISDILSLAIGHSALRAAVVVHDAQCDLASALAVAYRRCIPAASFIEFDTRAPADILAALALLAPDDLVVLIQSAAFRLDAYRLRVELFKRSLKVIEHVHLARMAGLQALYYIDSLAYDPEYFRRVGHALKSRIDAARGAVIDSGGALLTYASLFEPAKLNIGDYAGMHNIGGQFPIGEVFTEAQDLESLNGRVRLFAFGDTSFSVNQPERPITLVVGRGKVTAALDATPEFERVLSNIRADEGEVWVRELGFGMNRAFSKQRQVSDIGTYERMCGIHLSLGAKHGVYSKPHIRRKDARHHVDVFVDTVSVVLGDELVYRDGAWLVP